VPGTDAVVQEVDWLRARFGGEVLSLRPSWRARARYPRPLLGLHRLGAVRQLDRQVDLHHVYAPQLYWLPLLWLVRRPVVYTVTAGVGDGRRMPPAAFLRRLGAIVVPGRGDLEALHRRGLRNARLIRPGIDAARFADTPPPPGPAFVLVSGSAPWTREQFRTKGVDALLEAARAIPDLALVFLWRGVLLPELVARVRHHALSDRVEILSERVDVGPVLARAHAAVVLAERPGLVKAYPHSLLEALAAGRPVVVSDGTPMADYVRETGCGRVVPRPGVTGLIEAIRELRQDYDAYRARARAVGPRDFSLEDFLAAHRDLYRTLPVLGWPP
jgi:glycosyltransferase involved in cell wall biosynthesis